jgi:hypothetical protein
VREKTAETTELAAQLRSSDAAVGEMRLQLAAAVSAERRVDAVSVQKVSSLSSDCAERERTCAAPDELPLRHMRDGGCSWRP